MAGIGLLTLTELLTEDIAATLAETEAVTSLAGTTEAIGGGGGGAMATEMVSLSADSSSILTDGIATTSFSANNELGLGVLEDASANANEVAASMSATSNTMMISENEYAADSILSDTFLRDNELGAQTFVKQPIASSTPLVPGATERIGDLSTVQGIRLWDEIDMSIIMKDEDELELFSRYPTPTSANFLSSAFIRSSTSTVAPSSTSHILGATLIGGSVAGGAAAAVTIGGSTGAAALATTAIGTSTTTTAVGALALKIGTALGLGGGAAGSVIYKVVKTLEEKLPGTSEFIMDSLKSGNVEISEQTAINFLSMLMNRTNALARLEAAGINVALLKNGELAKVGSAIAQALRKPSTDGLFYESPNIFRQLTKTSPLIRNLNSDSIKNIWQARMAL